MLFLLDFLKVLRFLEVENRQQQVRISKTDEISEFTLIYYNYIVEDGYRCSQVMM